MSCVLGRLRSRWRIAAAIAQWSAITRIHHLSAGSRRRLCDRPGSLATRQRPPTRAANGSRGEQTQRSLPPRMSSTVRTSSVSAPWAKQSRARRPRNAADSRFRTIWAAPHLRAARALWSETGGRGGVSDLGGGEQPTAEANVASTSGSPSARTRNVALALGGPAMPDGTKAIEGHPRPHARACVRRPPRAAWRCASLRLIARRWPVLRNRGGRPAARGSRPPRAMIARGRAGAPRTVRAIAQARRASRQARPRSGETRRGL